MINIDLNDLENIQITGEVAEVLLEGKFILSCIYFRLKDEGLVNSVGNYKAFLNRVLVEDVVKFIKEKEYAATAQEEDNIDLQM